MDHSIGGAPLTRTPGEYSHDPISGVPEGPFSLETDIVLIAGGGRVATPRTILVFGR